MTIAPQPKEEFDPVALQQTLRRMDHRGERIESYVEYLVRRVEEIREVQEKQPIGEQPAPE